MEFTTGLMSLDTALNEMLSRVTPLTAQETLPLVQCFGRILASDVVSPLDVPGFDIAHIASNALACMKSWPLLNAGRIAGAALDVVVPEPLPRERLIPVELYMSDKIIHLTDDSFDTDVLKADGAILVDFWAEWMMRSFSRREKIS